MIFRFRLGLRTFSWSCFLYGQPLSTTPLYLSHLKKKLRYLSYVSKEFPKDDNKIYTIQNYEYVKNEQEVFEEDLIVLNLGKQTTCPQNKQKMLSIYCYHMFADANSS